MSKEDFRELEKKVDRLSEILAETLEIQKETKAELLKTLAEAQKKTEEEVKALAGVVEELSLGLKRTREELGGLSLSFSYAFENEAYRMLPSVLRNYGLVVEDKILRAEVGGKEINFFGKAKKEGKRSDVFKDLEERVLAVKRELDEGEITVDRKNQIICSITLKY